MQKKIIIILGPTATGKSQLAINLAQKISAEIISADSRQIYKFMNIGTAKLQAEEFKKVPHHLIDTISPDKIYSAGDFKMDAEKIIDDIFSRGKNVIIVGGTGLYIKALTHGIFESPKRNNETREQYEKIADEKGNQILYNRLKEIDPISAQKIHTNDLSRIVRALEFYDETGVPLSEQRIKSTFKTKYDYKIFGLKLDRAVLYQRINERVDKMINDGLQEEVLELIKKGYNENSPGLQCIGYKEIFSYLKGEYNLAKAIDLIKRNTRRYAKRQFTWFGHTPDITWFEILKNTDLEEPANEIIRTYL